MPLSFTFDGAELFEALMHTGKAVNVRPLLKLIGNRTLEWIGKQFDTRGQQGGTPWAPLRPSTLAMRKRGGDAPFQDTGKTKGSFTMEYVAYNVVWIGSRMDTAEWGHYGTKPHTIRAVRAKVLAGQLRGGGWAFFGKSVNHPGMPPRPMLPTDAVFERFIQPEVDSYIEGIINGSV